jgi:CRP-like cAMP-binding protein
VETSRSALHDLPILQFLPADVRELVVASFVPASFGFGSVIVRAGADADALYVLVAGRARVLREGENGEEISLNVLKPGDSFGEMALLEGARRTATVRASSDVEVRRLDRSVFAALIQRHPELRTYFELQVTHRRLHNFFRHYTPFARLPAEALRFMLSELQPVAVKPGDVVIRQGDEPGPMYIVEEGHLRVFTEEDGRRRYLAYYRSGDFFGEMSLFKGSLRAATVEALSVGRLLRLMPATFEKLIASYPEFKAQIEERVRQYDYKEVARVPLDFAEELLPAEAAVQEKVGPHQIEDVEEEETEDEDRAGPFASPDGHFVKGTKRIRRFAHIRQIDEMDCGAAALAMVCRHFGRAVSPTRIRQLVHTSIDGTSLRALCHAATELGLAARSVKASKRNLDQMPLPAIAHWQGNHWVVVCDVAAAQVRIADPAARGMAGMGRNGS